MDFRLHTEHFKILHSHGPHTVQQQSVKIITPDRELLTSKFVHLLSVLQ